MNTETNEMNELYEREANLIKKIKTIHEKRIVGTVNGEIKSKIRHSELMVRLADTVISNGLLDHTNMIKAKLKIIYNLIKANAIDIDYYMELCAKEDIITEGEYKEYVDGLMREIKVWDHLD